MAIDKKSSHSLPRARKRFGQNFLADKNSIARIVDLALVEKDDILLEIGPGRGAMTERLAETGCQLFALEIDRDLQDHLRRTFREADNVKIIEGDALSFDFSPLLPPEGRKIKVVANLPYNVATAILFRLFEMRGCISKMVLMFQKEVGERIVASPGTKSYGALSLFPQLYADIRIALKLPPAVFRPAPKIDSSVLVFDLLPEPRFHVADERLLKEIVSAAFSQRRKKLSNTVKTLFPEVERKMAIFSAAGIDPGRRGETLSVEEFCRLANRASEALPT